jgi:hypothetical protein
VPSGIAARSASAMAAGNLGGDQAKGLEREVCKLQLEDAGVFVLWLVVAEESAAADAGSVDLQSDARGAFEIEMRDRLRPDSPRRRET